MPAPLTTKRIDEDIHYTTAISEQLIELESALSNLVVSYSGRKRSGEAAAGQQFTKALASVQSSRNRLAKALEAMAEIEPVPSLFDQIESVSVEAAASVAEAPQT